MSAPLEVFVDDRRARFAAHTGIGTFGRLLIAGLRQRDDILLRCATRRARFAAVGIGHPGRLRKLLADQVVMRVDGRGADVFHALWHEVVPPRGVPLVLSLHDLSIVREPKRYSHLQRAYYGHFAHWLISRAALVVVPSQATAADVEGWRPRARVAVVTYPIDPVFLAPPGDNLPSELARHGLEAGSYLLYTGGIHARKDLDTLFAGVARVQRGDGCPPLVVTGAAPASVDARAAAAGCRVVRTGVLAPAQLRDLYAGAAAVVSASSSEGFGYSAAEALATGRPLVCPAGSALPETAGPAALTFPPGSAEGLWATIDQALRLTTTQKALIESGRAEAAQRFSLARAAEAFVACYRAALS